MNTQQIAVKQFREYIVTPVLQYLDMHSEAAVRLLLGTAAEESRFDFVKQLGDGPALGLYQMEPATHDDIWDNYLRFRGVLKDKVLFAVGAVWNEKYDLALKLIGDNYYATAMCRLHYRRIKAPLPEKDDIEGMGIYWKKHYNTHKGKGTVEKFVESYYELIGTNHAL